MKSGISALLPLFCLFGGIVALPAHQELQGRVPDLADDVVPGSLLPGRWYHGEDHAAHALFRRQDDGGSAQVGSPSASPVPSSLLRRFTYPVSLSSRYSLECRLPYIDA